MNLKTSRPTVENTPYSLIVIMPTKCNLILVICPSHGEEDVHRPTCANFEKEVCLLGAEVSCGVWMTRWQGQYAILFLCR